MRKTPSQEHEKQVAYWQQYLGSLAMDAELPTLRAGYDETMTAAAPLADDVEVEKTSLSNCDLFTVSVPQSRADKAILFFHGGGYILGSTLSCQEFLSRVARACRATAVSVEYRLAPEAPFPAALEDGVAAYRYALEQYGDASNIVVGGESAGGGLALSTVLSALEQELPAPSSVFGFSPWVDMEMTGATAKPGAVDDPTVAVEMLQLMQSLYIAEQPGNPLASPLNADLGGMPPMFLAAGTREVLYDDSVRLANKAIQAQVPVQFEPGYGLAHIWPLIAPKAPESDRVLQKLAAFVEPHWS